MKTFVTGVYGSGKTFLARQLAKENNEVFISFDGFIDYGNPHEQFDKLMSSVPESFVMDAIPFDINFKWDKFIEYQKEHDCQIICCYCPNWEVWLERVERKKVPRSKKEKIIGNIQSMRKSTLKQYFKAVSQLFLRLIKTEMNKFIIFIKKDAMKKSNSLLRSNRSNQLIEKQFFDYQRFVLINFSELHKMRNVQWFDSIANEYTTFEDAVKRINSGVPSEAVFKQKKSYF